MNKTFLIKSNIMSGVVLLSHTKYRRIIEFFQLYKYLTGLQNFRVNHRKSHNYHCYVLTCKYVHAHIAMTTVVPLAQNENSSHKNVFAPYAN